MRPAQVFLSYARIDDRRAFGSLTKTAIRLIEEVNTTHPAEVFVDYGNLHAGDHFPEKLDRRVRSADIFIACISPAYVKSAWCPKELALFQRAQLERKRTRAEQRVLIIRLPGTGDGVMEQLKLDHLHRWLLWEEVPWLYRVGLQRSLPEVLRHAANDLRRRIDQVRPKPVGKPATPLPRSFQFHSALDSVRTQRGSTNQLPFVSARVKLGYLLGYTAVLPEAQAFDSLGAIQCVSEAAKGWSAAAVRRVPPFPPFEWIHYNARSPHLTDRARERLATEHFESSAWYEHAEHRIGNGRALSLAEVERLAEYPRFLEAAEFLTWFSGRELAQRPSLDLLDRLQHLRERTVIEKKEGPLVRGLSLLVARGKETRSEMYALADQFGAEDPTMPVESLKDLVDLAYNRTIAESVLHAASPEFMARSFVLTDPTPSSEADDESDELTTLARWLAEQRAAEESEAFHREVFGAAEATDSESPAGSLSWSTLFEIVAEPDWGERYERLVAARRKGDIRRQGDALRELASWVRIQLSNTHVHLEEGADVGGVALSDNGAIATLGDEVMGVAATGAALS
ncbi:MAG: toll/interleukin-1 receptor domain-containing protein [Pseudomonadota bacterium]